MKQELRTLPLKLPERWVLFYMDRSILCPLVIEFSKLYTLFLKVTHCTPQLLNMHHKLVVN